MTSNSIQLISTPQPLSNSDNNKSEKKLSKSNIGPTSPVRQNSPLTHPTVNLNGQLSNVPNNSLAGEFERQWQELAKHELLDQPLSHYSWDCANLFTKSKSKVLAKECRAAFRLICQADHETKVSWSIFDENQTMERFVPKIQKAVTGLEKRFNRSDCLRSHDHNTKEKKDFYEKAKKLLDIVNDINEELKKGNDPTKVYIKKDSQPSLDLKPLELNSNDHSISKGSTPKSKPKPLQPVIEIDMTFSERNVHEISKQGPNSQYPNEESKESTITEMTTSKGRTPPPPVVTETPKNGVLPDLSVISNVDRDVSRSVSAIKREYVWEVSHSVSSIDLENSTEFELSNPELEAPLVQHKKTKRKRQNAIYFNKERPNITRHTTNKPITISPDSNLQSNSLNKNQTLEVEESLNQYKVSSGTRIFLGSDLDLDSDLDSDYHENTASPDYPSSDEESIEETMNSTQSNKSTNTKRNTTITRRSTTIKKN